MILTPKEDQLISTQVISVFGTSGTFKIMEGYGQWRVFVGVEGRPFAPEIRVSMDGTNRAGAVREICAALPARAKWLAEN